MRVGMLHSEEGGCRGYSKENDRLVGQFFEQLFVCSARRSADKHMLENDKFTRTWGASRIVGTFIPIG